MSTENSTSRQGNRQKRSLLEVGLMPVVVALVGILGTYFITKHQTDSSQRIRQAEIESAVEIANAQIKSSLELAQAEQDLKALEIFSKQISSDNPRERETAMRILHIVNADLAQQLGKIIIEDPSETARVKALAQAVVKRASLQPADLFVSEFDLMPKVPVQGKPVTVRIGVYNQGRNRAGPFTVQWFPGEKFPKPAHEWQLEGMAARGGRILTYTYSGYRSWYARIRTKVVIDPANQVKEEDKSNNVFLTTISVKKK